MDFGVIKETDFLSTIGLGDKTISKWDCDNIQVDSDDTLWTYLPDNTTARVCLFSLDAGHAHFQ